MANIGLFPLNLVLFPDALYPLHIFEERYKLLINESFSYNREFGVNYINNTGINHAGCTAKVSEVLKQYSDGKLDIVVQGLRRFKIERLQEGIKPYFTADIEYFDDDVYDIDVALLDECVRLFNKIADGITSVKIDKINISELSSKYPSYLIAQKAGLTADQKQSLLEIRSENIRLDSLSKHLRKIQPLIKRAEVISNIIKNDGYLKPDKI